MDISSYINLTHTLTLSLSHLSHPSTLTSHTYPSPLTQLCPRPPISYPPPSLTYFTPSLTPSPLTHPCSPISHPHPLSHLSPLPYPSHTLAHTSHTLTPCLTPHSFTSHPSPPPLPISHPHPLTPHLSSSISKLDSDSDNCLDICSLLSVSRSNRLWRRMFSSLRARSSSSS